MSTNAAFGFSGRLCIRSTSASRPPAEAPMPTVTKGSLAEAATGAGAVSAFFTLFFTEVVFLGIGGRNYHSSATPLLHKKEHARVANCRGRRIGGRHRGAQRARLRASERLRRADADRAAHPRRKPEPAGADPRTA